jgi:GrpB-like predicted nucleotidyltransferase (UPF0157 family)
MTSEPSSIGLRRGVVELHAPNTAWADAFRAEAQRLARHVADAELPPLVFEHIGSTAVPGLVAKPIIDLLAGHQPENDPRVYFLTLQAAGYEHRGPQGVPEREFFVRGPESHRTHHLNLVPVDGVFWRQHLMFRDRLRNEPAVRAAYAALKQQLAAAHPDDRGAYTDGKASFVSHIVHEGFVLLHEK